MPKAEPSTLPRAFASVSLCLLIAIASIAWWRASPPSAKAENAPRDDFSALRAAEELRFVLGPGGPHPVGSGENAAVRRRIGERLKALGLTPELQNATVCGRYGACAEVSNLIARRPGRVSAPAVMLAAHYDSVPAGPGAADDGSGVATLLEIARALSTGPELEHPVVFLFDDGEEAGLLGAQAFVSSHPLAKDIAVVINVEARGDEGPSLMFETSANNAELVRAYARSVPRPVTSSLFYGVYRRLPNDTDLTVFKASGMAGFNVAPVGGVTRYHTPLDDIAHLDLGTLQQQGDTALALTRELGNQIPKASPGDLVYFDVFALRVVRWPVRATRFVLGGIFVLLVVVSVLGTRRRLFAPKRILARAALWPLPLVFVALLGFGFFRLVGSERVPSWPAHPVVPLSVIAALAFIGVVAPSARSAEVTSWDEWGAAVFWWTVLSVASTLLFTEASYLFLVPTAFAALFGLVACLRPDVQNLQAFALAAPAIASVAIFLPTLRLMYQALGLEIPALMLVTTALSLSFIAPPVAALPLRRRRLLLSTGALVLVVAAIATAFVPAYSAASPKRASLAYAADESTHAARWLLDATSPPLPDDLVRSAAFSPRPVDPAPWHGGWSPRALEAPATALPLSAPSFEIVSTHTESDTTELTARVASTRGAQILTLHFPPNVRVRSVTLAGQSAALRHGSKFDSVTYLGAPGALDLVMRFSGHGTLLVSDHTPGLPDAGKALIDARPPSVVPSQFGDTTVVTRRVEI